MPKPSVIKKVWRVDNTILGNPIIEYEVTKESTKYLHILRRSTYPIVGKEYHYFTDKVAKQSEYHSFFDSLDGAVQYQKELFQKAIVEVTQQRDRLIALQDKFFAEHKLGLPYHA